MHLRRILTIIPVWYTIMLPEDYVEYEMKTIHPWIIAIISVVICDLVAGLRKSHLLGIHISPSRAGRETAWKAVVYFSIVIMLSSVENAARHDLPLTLYGCLFVCGLEGLSIVGNILKPKGFYFSFRDLLAIAWNKFTGRPKQEVSDMLKEERIEIIKRRERVKWNDIDTEKVRQQQQQDNHGNNN